MKTCRACGREHDPLWRCTDPRIVQALNATVAQRPFNGVRRTRETFNAYMRLYMQTRRAIEAGRASPIER